MRADLCRRANDNVGSVLEGRPLRLELLAPRHVSDGNVASAESRYLSQRAPSLPRQLLGRHKYKADRDTAATLSRLVTENLVQHRQRVRRRLA